MQRSGCCISHRELPLFGPSPRINLPELDEFEIKTLILLYWETKARPNEFWHKIFLDELVHSYWLYNVGVSKNPSCLYDCILRINSLMNLIVGQIQDKNQDYLDIITPLQEKVHRIQEEYQEQNKTSYAKEAIEIGVAIFFLGLCIDQETEDSLPSNIIRSFYRYFFLSKSGETEENYIQKTIFGLFLKIETPPPTYRYHIDHLMKMGYWDCAIIYKWWDEVSLRTSATLMDRFHKTIQGYKRKYQHLFFIVNGPQSRDLALQRMERVLLDEHVPYYRLGQEELGSNLQFRALKKIKDLLEDKDPEAITQYIQKLETEFLQWGPGGDKKT